jgi:hypothetical protein
MIPNELKPYLDICATLFPLHAGTKIPSGIVQNWSRDASNNQAVIEAWAVANPGCNWAMVAASSGLIVADVDTKHIGRDAAWQAWCDVCTSWGVPVLQPQVETPSGGWHIYARIPEGIDATSLRQRALKAKVIDIRTNGFVLIPPSKVDGKPYAHLQRA